MQQYHPSLQDTQKDLFESEEDLPEWLHVDWICQNKQPERVIGDYSLPSVQCSLPSILKLSTFSFSAEMLRTEEGIKTIFRYFRLLYQQIVSTAAQTAIIDLDRSLNYISAFAQNIEMNGDEETLNLFARELKYFMIQAGSLSRYIANDDMFATRNVETNYTFHALLVIWMKAVRISHFLKRFDGFGELYPMSDALSSAEQLSLLVAYGLLLSASRAGRPSICRCVNTAWCKLHVLNGEMFWSNMAKLLELCTGGMRYDSPDNPTSHMFLDLCTANGTISAEMFLQLICELDASHIHVCAASGKTSSNYVDFLRRIALKVANKKHVLRKLYLLFDKAHDDGVRGTESILQFFFTHLCSTVMEFPERELDFFPASGKYWKGFLVSCRSENEDDGYNEWMLFIRLFSLLTKKSSSVWRAMKSRIFSKFPIKRFREMPVHSLICIFSLFIASLQGSDMEETSNKIISLATAAFDPSDKERHDVLIRAVQCVNYILEEDHRDCSQATTALISLMGRLDEKKDVSLYVECCMCIGEKIAEVGSLARFLPFMNDMDLEQFFVLAAKCRVENNVLWNAAVNHLRNSSFTAAVTYIFEQLAIRTARNTTLALQNMQYIVQNLLAEKNYQPEVCSHFLKEFMRRNNEVTYPVELIVPVWLTVALQEPETDELNDISINICKKLIVSFRKNGLYPEMFTSSSLSTTCLIRWLFETMSKNERTNKKWIYENMMEWSELLVPPLQCTLMRAEEMIVMHCCRITSYLYLYAAQQIYKPPSECNFNRSTFVRLCKLILQNVLLVREFPIVYIREVLPNYMAGILSLPVHSVPYLLRVVSDMLEKYSNDYILKETFAKMLRDKPQIATALYVSSKVGTNLFSFVSQIK